MAGTPHGPRRATPVFGWHPTQNFYPRVREDRKSSPVPRGLTTANPCRKLRFVSNESNPPVIGPSKALRERIERRRASAASRPRMSLEEAKASVARHLASARSIISGGPQNPEPVDRD